MKNNINLKGKPARHFIAARLVKEHGEKALNYVAQDSPMERAVKAEIEYQREKMINESFSDSQGCY